MPAKFGYDPTVVSKKKGAQAGRQAGRQAGSRQAGRQAGTHARTHTQRDAAALYSKSDSNLSSLDRDSELTCSSLTVTGKVVG